jgi:hypothetical protein
MMKMNQIMRAMATTITWWQAVEITRDHRPHAILIAKNLSQLARRQT